ncbi:MAG: hypothetical protein M3Z28_05705 [Candidatus Dormibacteraeota bacterium]|nr:hypothetical protein [Candidatus Dormibacteraeota bacterium]
MPLLLELPGLALVAGCLALGLGLAAGGPPWLTAAERLVIGLTVAVVGLTMAGYVAALAVGVTVGLVFLLALGSAAVGGFLLWRHRGRYYLPASPRRSGAPYLPAFPRRSGAPFALPAAVAAVALGMGYLFARAVEITPDAWLAHYNNTWSDWSFHASYTTAFVYGHNLPPQNPIFAGTPFRYTFGPDFASALLVGGGWSIPAALTWPSWAMTVLALSGLILWARRLTGGLGAGVIAVTLTLLGGGVGFWYFFGDAARLGLLNALTHIPRTYDRFAPPVNIQWYNPILSYYLPQRSFVFGAAIVMAVLLLLTPLLLTTPFFRWRQTLATMRASWRRWSLNSEGVAMLVAGALAGLLPLFHVHSLVVLGIVTGCWALLFPRPAWLAFFAVMLVLAVPRLLMAVPGDPGAPPDHQYPRLMAGWMSQLDPPSTGYDLPPWFWLKNTGLFWPLLLTALLSPLALRGRVRLLIAPFALVFLVANVIKFQPWNWDNSKVLVFWYMASGVAVGAVLVRLARAHVVGGILAVGIWLSLVASGVLSLMQFLPPQRPAFVWFTTEEVQLAARVREQTSPHAVFVTGEEPNNPIADLAGRPVLMSYPGWLWSYGINYSQRQEDIGRIYGGGPQLPALLSRYHVDYIVIGPAERSAFQPNINYFNAQFRRLLHTPNYDVYAVH